MLLCTLPGSTKREPTVVGKPAEFMLANIAAQFGLKRSQICMVGDRLDTDILFGQQGGLTTMLVLSGAHKTRCLRCCAPLSSSGHHQELQSACHR
jgi:phosphoglycolate phosphatase